MQFVIGIDTGGTFTDITVVDERGNMVIAKSPTTSDHLTGIVSAIAAAAEALGVSTTDLIASTTKFVYGTTVAINALLQRLSDGQVGLIATRGFADTLYLRRSMREDQYNSQEPFPLPFVRRAHTREVTERIDWAGKVVIPLDEDEARRVIRQLVREKKLVKDRIGAVAVCLIHAYANPAHEGRIAELLHEEFPDILVSLSSDVAPEIREYERMSTTVFNACIGNTTVTHFEALQTELRRRGLKAPILIMHAAGGASGIPEVNARPIITLYSGPAAGLVAARYMSELMNMPNIISVDMGGTSFDVGIVQGGEMIRTMSGKLAGFPIMRDSVEIHSIGAGGGSIAWVDDQGIPKVGPQSAGAVPGPVCYDRGGVEPPVTDADVVLGYLDPDNFLGGKIRQSHEKAYQAIKERFADKIGLS
ncbi:MAG: hydantoinase/oxoprolinase family protein, partial [Chloroflexi bacterium]|nr:hydantoinase/oxoprolinase family protein [Chloroflexota bacterium]